ncbi:MAG: hypothetical protein GY888_09105, partial [Planctomycetaceae bacterium]|nr:hypothetical protein [Planctomycetaceae bacterium]
WVQHGDQVHVYFNQDDLDIVAAQTREFYQLIYTNQTVENTDDVTFLPSEDGGVRYYPEADMAIVTFDKPIHELTEADGARQDTTGSPATTPLNGGAFRMRIGTNEEVPMVPYRVDLGDQLGQSVSLDAADNFQAALPAGDSLVINASGGMVSEGDSFRLTDSQGTTKIFEFDPGYTLLLPAEGVSQSGVWDGQRFQVNG